MFIIFIKIFFFFGGGGCYGLQHPNADFSLILQRKHSSIHPSLSCYISQMIKSMYNLFYLMYIPSFGKLWSIKVIYFSPLFLDKPNKTHNFVTGSANTPYGHTYYSHLLYRYAIYIPLFLPVSLPVLLSLKEAIQWLRRKNAKEEKEKEKED